MGEQDEKTMGILAHVLGIVSGFVGPLIIYIIQKDKKGMGYENAKHALNFQISLFIYYIVAFILVFIFIGIFLMIAIGVFSLIVMIMGAVAASDGKVYKYPLEIPFIS